MHAEWHPSHQLQYIALHGALITVIDESYGTNAAKCSHSGNGGCVDGGSYNYKTHIKAQSHWMIKVLFMAGCNITRSIIDVILSAVRAFLQSGVHLLALKHAYALSLCPCIWTRYSYFDFSLIGDDRRILDKCEDLSSTATNVSIASQIRKWNAYFHPWWNSQMLQSNSKYPLV